MIAAEGAFDEVEGEPCLLGPGCRADKVFHELAMPPLLIEPAEAACSTGAVMREQADHWIAEQRTRAGADRLFLALPMFVAAATR